MKAPHFELKKDDDLDSVAKDILQNNTALHFTRRRNLMSDGSVLGFIVDSTTRYWFEDERESSLKRLNNPLSSFGNWLFAPVMFLIFLSVIIYHLFLGNFTKPDADIGVTVLIFALAAILLGISVWSLIHYIRKYRFLKKAFTKMDDLFVVYDSDNVPCSVCVRDSVVKVLYKDTVYTVKNGKVKQSKKDNQLYRAYLNMLPWSVLDMDRFYPNERYRPTGRESFDPVITNTYILSKEEKCCISVNNTVLHSYRKGHHSSSHADRNKPLQFIKYLFEFDDNFQLNTVYSVANESFRFDFNYITKADLVQNGERALMELKNIVNCESGLKSLWDENIKIDLR